MNYETDILTHSVLMAFKIWFNSEIGTDMEVNEIEEGQFYAVCFDLEGDEVERCRAAENALVAADKKLN